jgi:hypothetical protein
MKRAILAAVTAILFSSSAVHSPAGAADQGGDLSQIVTLSKAAHFHFWTDRGSAASGQCCKICHKGKACGDTCISRQDTCHVGQGCACDG